MKSVILCFASTLAIVFNCLSQDQISMTSGEVLLAKIIQKNSKEVRCYKYPDSTRVMFILFASDIESINYSDGRREVINPVRNDENLRMGYKGQFDAVNNYR